MPMLKLLLMSIDIKEEEEKHMKILEDYLDQNDL